MEHFNDSLKLPFYSCNNKKMLTHVPQSQNCLCCFHVLGKMTFNRQNKIYMQCIQYTEYGGRIP